MVGLQVGAVCLRGDDPVAVGDQVRLDEAVDAGRPARGVGGDDIVAGIAVAPMGDRTHGDDLARVARAGDGAIAVAPGVTGGGHHHHTGIPHRLDRLHQGIIGGGLIDRMAEREVDHADVVAVAR